VDFREEEKETEPKNADASKKEFNPESIKLTLIKRILQKNGQKRKRGVGAHANKRPVNLCEHTDLPFYAKGMCKNCYHQRGRQKLSDKCPHLTRPNYAHGVCKNCYLSQYHRTRRAQLKK
jgi:hypothetical protein